MFNLYEMLNTKESVFIGSGSENDIVLDDPEISQRHCQISKVEPGVYLVVDLNSAGGTYINNERMKTGFATEADIIKIGNNILRLKKETSDTAADVHSSVQPPETDSQTYTQSNDENPSPAPYENSEQNLQSNSYANEQDTESSFATELDKGSNDQAAIKCSYCGAVNLERYRFCQKCGSPLSFSSENENRDDPKERSFAAKPQTATYVPQNRLWTGKTKLIAIIGILVLIGIVIFFLLKLIFGSDYNVIEPKLTSNNADKVTTPATQDKHQSLSFDETNPQQSILNLIGENTWKGDITFMNGEKFATAELKVSAGSEMILELPGCTSHLSFSGFKRLEEKIYQFVFEENGIKNSKKCIPGPLSVKASFEQPNLIHIMLHGSQNNDIAQGDFARP